MPNGHQEDTRPLWQRVKDMEAEYEKSLDLNFKMRQQVQCLEVDKEALLVSLKLLREEGK